MASHKFNAYRDFYRNRFFFEGFGENLKDQLLSFTYGAAAASSGVAIAVVLLGGAAGTSALLMNAATAASIVGSATFAFTGILAMGATVMAGIKAVDIFRKVVKKQDKISDDAERSTTAALFLGIALTGALALGTCLQYMKGNLPLPSLFKKAPITESFNNVSKTNVIHSKAPQLNSVVSGPKV